MLVQLNLLLQSLYTVLIVLFLGLVFFVHRHFIEANKDRIKTAFIALVYGLLFLILGGSIVTLLFIWGYDISDYLSDLIDNAAGGIEQSIPRIIGSLVTLFVALALYKIVKVSLFQLNRKESPHHRRRQTISKVSLSIFKYIIATISTLSILAIWGINVGPAIAGLGILGLVIGLGAQKFINDLISGFFIIFENHYNVGDWVDIGGFMGEVTDIGLKTTKVKNFRGEVKIFNNGSIDPVSNFSISNSLAIVDFGIAYKEDIEKAMTMLSEKLPAMQAHHEEMLEAPRVLGVTHLDSSSVNMRVVVLVRSMTQWGIERALRKRIKELLNEANIEIPFPQVVIHQPK